MADVALLSIIAIVLSAGVGAFIGHTNGSVGLGFLLGFLLGPLGLIIVASQGPNRLERRRRILDRERVDTEWAERAERMERERE